MPSFFAPPALLVLASLCLVHVGQASAAPQAATPPPGRSAHDVLAVDDSRLHWRHDEQVLELVATGDGLLVTQASQSPDLQLQRGDRVRTAGRTQVISVAHLLDALRAAAGKPIAIDVLRDGVQMRLTWTAATYMPLLPPAPG